MVINHGSFDRSLAGSTSGNNRKRPRPEDSASIRLLDHSLPENDDEEEEDKWWQQFTLTTVCDTTAALRMMCAQFPLVHKSARPFVLRSQLYSVLKDKTQVDRDLETLKIQKVIRLFKLNTGKNDHAVMFMDDYLAQIETAEKGLSVDNKERMQVFAWFKTYVVDSKHDVQIQHRELCSLLSLGGKVVDEHVSLLINSGLLTHQLIDSNMYWFAIPNIGTILKGLSQGRKELISLLQRKKFKEMPLISLEKKKLRMSPLGVRFHLRDLIGSGDLKTHDTPVGIFVRISKD